jgi:glycosyltransferase involved in cell wall biosynthesis
VKAITTVHNYVFIDLKLYYHPIVSWFLGMAWMTFWIRFDALVALTDDARSYYLSRSFNKRVKRIYNGRDIHVDPTVIMPQHRQMVETLRKEYQYVIGTCAMLISGKRIDILIRLLSRVPSGSLVILGDGPERKNLEHMVSILHLQDRVKFLGHVRHAHQYNVLFDIFAHPSLSEGFSLSLIEAAMHQKKIVCSDIPCFKEAFDDTEVTFFNSDDEASIDQAVEEALRDDLKPMKAYTRAITYYAESAMADAYSQLYTDLIQEKVIIRP